MKNVHLLPTDKSSRIRIGDNGNFVIGLTQNSIRSRNDSFTNQHIYITSDGEIKDGEYGICLNLVREGLKSHQAVFKMDSEQRQAMEDLGGQKKAKVLKVILTTDQNLIKDGVQAIDDEFLEWFVNNPSCESVEVVNDEYVDLEKDEYVDLYKIIIPQEESKRKWNPTQGEEVWIKVFSNWSKGTYIGYDTTKHIHLVRENEEGGGNLLSSSKILPYKSMPNEPKQETLEDIKLEEVYGSTYCKFSIIENKLAILYRNQEQLLKAIKLLNNEQ